MGSFIQALEELNIMQSYSKYKSKTVNKEDIREKISMHLKQLEDVSQLFSAIPQGDRRIMAQKIVAAASVKGNLACDMYCKIARTLRRDDLRDAFSSYIAVCLTYKKILEQFNRSMDKWFTIPRLSLFNTKLSQLVIFGVMEEVNMFCKYTTSMFGFVTYEITRHNNISELQEPRKYRKMYIIDKADQFTTNCVRRLADNPYIFSSDMDKAASEIDVNIVDEDGNANTAFMNSSAIPSSLQHSLTIGTKSFIINIFRWIGEQWVMHKHLQYLRQTKEKEWMEAHVALLKMDLANADPNSEEYRKLVGIIDNYNDQLAELDQKIAAYEQEE